MYLLQAPGTAPKRDIAAAMFPVAMNKIKFRMFCGFLAWLMMHLLNPLQSVLSIVSCSLKISRHFLTTSDPCVNNAIAKGIAVAKSLALMALMIFMTSG